MKEVIIYTDGACRGNPGLGGWGVLMQYHDENKELYGSVKPTEISKLIHEKENEEINPSNIQPSKEIKSLGEFKVEINLHSDVQTQITVKVVPQEEIK